MNNFKRDIINEFALNATKKGFIVYVNNNVHYAYACFSHPDHLNRVCYVQYEDLSGLLAFGGLYKPHSEGGTGWGITKTSDLNTSSDWLIQVLVSGVPTWASRNYTLETLESYLKRSNHSDYQLFEVK